MDYALLALIAIIPALIVYKLGYWYSKGVESSSILAQLCGTTVVIRGYSTRPNWVMLPIALPSIALR